MNPWTTAARRLQDRLLDVIGGGDREPTIGNMLVRDARESVSYWLQLGVSVGIATLGLALGSTAVVIAAMLVAPLMGPIVSLGMGMATGGPLLTLRATLRVGSSVVVVIVGSALVTSMLPFHEVNAEIAARTVPTALDLITAAFCALAGAYAAVRTTSDTATTAAGTSIGISLVPPLCAAGFCIGTAQWSLAMGALLLFVTNMVAIVLVGMLAFIALGFNQVAVARLEAEHLTRNGRERAVRAVARGLASVFASSWGRWSRLLMPLVLLAVVYVPLRRALDEVTWQVKVRAEARRLLDSLDAEVVASRVRVERHRVEATIVMIGTRAQAIELERELAAELAEVSGVTPRVAVRAVPDAAAAAAVEPLLPVSPTATPPLSQSFDVRIDAVHDDLIDSLSSRWPSSSLGDLLAVDVDATAEDLRLTVSHVGAAIDETAREILERVLEDGLGMPVTLRDVALPAEPSVVDDSVASIARVAALAERSRRLETVSVCMYVPPTGPEPEPPTEPEPVQPTEEPDAAPTEIRVAEARTSAGLEALRTVLAEHPRVISMPSDQLAIAFTAGECPLRTGDSSAP